MKSLLNKLFENHSLIYKTVLFILSVTAIVYLFPKGSQFKYQFQKGKIWQYDDFVAPFDFAIQKSTRELASERQDILNNQMLFFTYDDSIALSVIDKLEKEFSTAYDSTKILSQEKNNLFQTSEKFINQVYKWGVTSADKTNLIKDNERQISLKRGNEVNIIPYYLLYNSKKIEQEITLFFETQANSKYKNSCIHLVQDVLKQNVFFDAKFTDNALQEKLNALLPTRGFVPKNRTIISQGEIVEGEKFTQLQSIQKEYESKTWSASNYIWLVTAYTFLVGLALIMLLLFIKKYRPELYENNSKISFLFINIVLIILISTLVLNFNINYLYVIPYVILPLIIKAFFDARLGLFTHVLTILLVGFIVPNSFEFIFIQIIAGIVTILTVSELNKRANLFISVAQITGIYLVSYFAFSITQEGNASHINWLNIGLFALNGMITASVVIPIIFTYEKLFGLISDESLREFSDSNNKLLRELNEKAPGTFQHSMQVANLAEAAAKEINANAILVRTGALYHDIGKMLNPMYFTENQATSVNPHDELGPEDSAQIIIEHVIKGIELAKKNKLPDRLIDFIRTHHGTSFVYYFYKKEMEINPEGINLTKFRYPGPIPFSKETAILMICDAAEAASKSLKKPTALAIDDLINKIVRGQMDNGQFQNAAITFKEIEQVKKVVKKKLNNIYHVRIEYPE